MITIEMIENKKAELLNAMEHSRHQTTQLNAIILKIEGALQVLDEICRDAVCHVQDTVDTDLATDVGAISDRPDVDTENPCESVQSVTSVCKKQKNRRK